MARGCGNRVMGGVYLVTDMSPGGKPVEWFVVDEPVPLDPRIPARPRGVTKLQDTMTTHVLDWVGSKHYPNIADFLEEVRRMGLSRRIPKNFDFASLNEWSKVVLVHSRAIILNADEYGETACVKEACEHGDIGLISTGGRIHVAAPGQDLLHDSIGGLYPDSMCAGLYWCDMEIPKDGVGGETCRCVMPSFTYYASTRPEGVEPVYAVGIFAMFPISRIVVIKDPNRPVVTEELAARIRSRTWLQVDTEDR